MVKILFVCLGNICRSPLAEAIFTAKIGSLGLEEQISADSAGTSNYHIGEDPDDRTFEVAHRNEIPLYHKARQLTRTDFTDFDYILAMDRSNLRSIQSLQPKGNNLKIMLLREFDKDVEMDVPDPYYGGKDGFDQVYSILDQAIDNLVKFLREKHNL